VVQALTPLDDCRAQVSRRLAAEKELEHVKQLLVRTEHEWLAHREEVQTLRDGRDALLVQLQVCMCELRSICPCSCCCCCSMAKAQIPGPLTGQRCPPALRPCYINKPSRDTSGPGQVVWPPQPHACTPTHTHPLQAAQKEAAAALVARDRVREEVEAVASSRAMQDVDLMRLQHEYETDEILVVRGAACVRVCVCVCVCACVCVCVCACMRVCM